MKIDPIKRDHNSLKTSLNSFLKTEKFQTKKEEALASKIKKSSNRCKHCGK